MKNPFKKKALVFQFMGTEQQFNSSKMAGYFYCYQVVQHSDLFFYFGK
jgi:hypothetical protein